ncbi:hypothetical protein QVD17_35404 [Tagetes erecta]|uniref:Protein kinase domain-containing protein n=1 Tax=Tagetes erecta TaxID=13708 RepID=A0AAD8NMI0_TARER|nr:hypothetical protein QVD17_35404 [Tagetes erecta]
MANYRLKRELQMGDDDQNMASSSYYINSLNEYMYLLEIPFHYLALATNNFADKNLLTSSSSSSAFKVYKGQLDNSVDIVASKYENGEILKEFSICHLIKHENIVPNYKYASGGDFGCIITKYEANGSLEKHLNGPTLKWMQRLYICLRIAHALKYLHYDVQDTWCIIHGNVKSSKILLDSNWEPKLRDFRSAIKAEKNSLYLIGNYNSSPHYKDPEYDNTGGLTRKSDVFAFGVVLFEVLFGREAASIQSTNDNLYFVQLARSHYEDEKLDDLIDPDLRNQMNLESLNIFVETAYCCIKEQRSERPNMNQVISKLEEAFTLQYQHENPTAEGALSSNHLKDKNENWVAKIADFGLSKLHHSNQQGCSTHVTNNIAGTNIYLDPEYKSTGRLKAMSDIYSFGVVLFEIMCGKLAYNKAYGQNGLPSKVRQCFKEGTLNKLIDHNIMEANENILIGGVDRDSLETFINIAHQCLAESQSKRPKIEDVIKELEKTLNFQITNKNNTYISLEAIKLGTQNFSSSNCIGEGKFWKLYNGVVKHANGCVNVVAKRWDTKSNQRYLQFSSELNILSRYKSESIIGLVGYCNEGNENIIVYENASNGILTTHLGDPSFTWKKRLKICVDIAKGLSFIHGRAAGGSIKHIDIKSDSILLDGDWNAKIYCFELSCKKETNEEAKNFDRSDCDSETISLDARANITWGCLRKGSDIYSLGIILIEMLCGRLAWAEGCDDHSQWLGYLASRHYDKNKNLSGMIFEGIKEQIGPNLLNKYEAIAIQCLEHDERKQPDAWQVEVVLEEILQFQLQLDDQDGFFSDWNESFAGDSPCNFTGVICSKHSTFSGTGFVESVDFSNANIAGTFPIILCKLTRLKHISFYNNSINGTLSGDISGCRNLVSLNLAQNLLTGELPATLSDLPELKFLDLTGGLVLVVMKKKRKLYMPLNVINVATQNFSQDNYIEEGRFWKFFKGEIEHANGCTPIMAKRWDKNSDQLHDILFLNELDCYFKCMEKKRRHNIIGLVGYCKEENERIIVYEYASNGRLNKYLDDPSLTWIKRLKIGIDIANGFGDICNLFTTYNGAFRSRDILLDDDWNAKISNINQYIGPEYPDFLGNMISKYSIGVILIEMLCGRLIWKEGCKYNPQPLDIALAFSHDFANETLDEMVFEGIKKQIAPELLIRYRDTILLCLRKDPDFHLYPYMIEMELKEVLEFQEDYEEWEAKLPINYKEIIPDSSGEKKKDLYNTLLKGILLPDGKVFFSIGSNIGERTELISATKFSFKNRSLHKFRSVKGSRFSKVKHEEFDKLKDVQQVFKSETKKNEFLPSNTTVKKHHVIWFSSDNNIIKRKKDKMLHKRKDVHKSSKLAIQSRFILAADFLQKQVFHIQCKIKIILYSSILCLEEHAGLSFSDAKHLQRIDIACRFS